MRNKQYNTFTDKIFGFFDSSAQIINRTIKSNPRTLIDIETVEDEHTLTMKDGTLLTAVKIEGVSKVVLADELVEILDETEKKFSAYMSDGCHYPSFYFMRDEDNEEELESVFGAMRRSAESKDLDLGDLIDEQKKIMSSYCSQEKAFLLLWSNIKGLSKEEKMLAAKRKKSSRNNIPLASHAQNIASGADFMMSRHKSFVSGICEDLKHVNVATRVLGKDEFLREIRKSIDDEFTSDDWEAFLPGSPVPMRIDTNYKPDMSGMLWPPIEDQLFPRKAENKSDSTVEIGGRIFAPLTIALMPKKPAPFQTLFKRLNKENVPWRMHQLIRSDGLSILSFKELLASFVQFIPGAPENKYIIDVKKNLTALRDKGEDIVKLQIAFSTWAPKGEQTLLETRKAILARCIQGWGNCDVAEAEGDGLESFMSSTPGGVIGSVGTIAAAPLYDALKMAPLTRPASAWSTGSQIFRTVDGKISYYQPYSKLQTAWVTLIFAPMGYGKSVFMNYSNLSLILNPEFTELPYISILDIGPSSRGLIELIRDALPKEKRHYAIYERLKNTRDYTINVFDTKLGLRKPLSTQKEFLVDFLTYLSLPDNQQLPVDGAPGISSYLIDLVYEQCSDRKSAKKYQPSVLPKIDAILEKLEFELDQVSTKWWDVVDYLYKEGYTHEATLAQRHAVPTLNDISLLAQDSRVISVYGDNVVLDTQEKLPKYYWRKMAEAMTLYPIIDGVTQFDLGEARIISLDLDEVAKGKGEAAKRKVGLMYMTAYYILTNHFFTGKSHLQEMSGEVGIYNVDYRPYHRKVIKGLDSLPKRFCIDEKQNVKGITAIEDQMDKSIVEGRKWKVEVMQASQLPNDFSAKSVDLATNTFILGGGGASNCAKITETFKLSPTMQFHLENSMRKPCKAGATLLMSSEVNGTWYEQNLMSTQGPSFIWACNSTRDDAYVRDTLSVEIGSKKARKLLVEFYPSGNLDDEIEKRKHMLELQQKKQKYQGEDLSSRDAEKGEEIPLGILDEIVQEILAVHKSRGEQAAA